MKPFQKTILIICCLLGMGISFIYHARINHNSFDKIKAPVYVNIEVDKAYMSSVSIVASFNNGDKLFHLTAEISNTMRTVILFSEIRNENQTPPYIHTLFLCIPKDTSQEVLDAIEAITIFIGNKMIYFSHVDVINLQGSKVQNNYILFELPGLEYKKSVITNLLNLRPLINWYGDFNLALKTILAFITQPGKFIITWCFLICFLVLCWSNIENIYSVLRKQKRPWVELLPLSFIVLTGFVLRLNGYVRYSSWLDELYSACQASNPALPFMNTFEDPGNPPFYFILLRLWFMLFGWAEESGRLFSVLTGSAAIISLYVMVKQFTNKKAAFLAAIYMSLSAYLVGFSQEMRPYILEVFLVSIAAQRLFIIIQKRELNLKNLIGYIIPSVLLVNTHYYGSLFVFASFLFFLAYSVRTKIFTWKKTVVFFSGNIIIASSLLPYFIHTAFRKALLNSDFNTWISKPGLTMICMAALIPLMGILYIHLRRTVFQKILSGAHECFLDYAVFVMAAVYLIAFGISLYRPILTTRYLVILYPFLVSVIAITIMNIFTNSSKFIGGLCIVFAFAWIVSGYDGIRGGNTDVYQEAQAYISKDAEAHPKNISVEEVVSSLRVDRAKFYDYKQLPLYTNGENYDVLYINPLHRSEEKIYSETAALGINQDRILRIHINDSKSVFKIYSYKDN